MIVSLIVPGDERKQMVVWKASTYTLIGTVGSLAISIAEKMISQQALLINPFTQLGATALIYFVFLLYYKDGTVADPEKYHQSKTERVRAVAGRSGKKMRRFRQTINAIENDKYDPTLALAFRLAQELTITVDELFRPTP